VAEVAVLGARAECRAISCIIKPKAMKAVEEMTLSYLMLGAKAATA
jgi:hypothetical protein